VKVFNLTTGADTGGWGGRLKEAFDRHGPRGWSCRAMVNADNYIGYPYDLPYRQENLERFYDEADVVQLHNTLHGHDFYDDGQGKPTVLLHHGTLFRDSPDIISAQARAIGALQFCSTIDLERPGVEWLGVPYSLDGPISTLPNRGIAVSFAELRQARYRPSERVRIAHAPTNRRIKGTQAFLGAMRSLVERGLPVEMIFIENQPWAKCLARKAQADIFVDQLVLGYGCNAVEAWALGIPVVAGVADPAVRARMIERWGRLPFAEASEATLEHVLEDMVRSVLCRAEYALAGEEHVRRWHDQAVVAPRLAEIYASAPATVPGGRSKRKGAAARPVLVGAA
jgi:hypothetical protein